METTTSAEQPDLRSELLQLKIIPHPDEKVFAIIPKHTSKVFRPLVAVTILTIAVVFGLLMFALFFTPTSSTFLLVAMVLGIVYLTVLVYGLSEWFSFKQSAVVITNERIIENEQLNVVNRKAQEFDIHAVKNASGNYNGPLGRFFKFGTVKIERLGQEPIEFKHMPYPALMAQDILHYHHLVAHGAAADAHNFQAETTEEDKTPELEQIMQKADKLAATGDPESSNPKMVSAAATSKDNPAEPPKPNPNQQPPKEDSPTTTEPAKLPPQSKASLLMFEVPSAQLSSVTNELSSVKEPVVNYKPDSDSFNVEAVVPPEETENIAKKLKSQGITSIMASEVEAL